MVKRINLATLSSLIALLLLTGCQTITSKDGSSVEDAAQKQDWALIRTGVPPELHEQAVEEGEKAKQELQQLKQDGSLSATAKRILAEAEEAEEQGDQELYLAKIQEYRRIITDEPLKRAAESYELEARVLFSQLRLEEAQQTIEEAVNLDSSNPNYLLILANYLLWNGDYQTMEEVSLQAVALTEKAKLGGEELLPTAYSYLGSAYLYRGEYSKAHNFLQQSLAMNKKLLGQEHPYVATSLNNLALLYKKQGKYEQAEPLYQQALAIREKLLGEEHPDVAISLNNLAGLYYSQRKYEQAEPLFLEALAMKKKLLGEQHPSVATSSSNLAGLYESQGKYEAAEDLYLETLKMAKKLLGEEHPNTQTINTNLLDLQDKIKQRSSSSQ